MQLQVNPEPLVIAMKEAGIINEEKFSAWRRLKLSTTDKSDPELRNLSPKYLEAKRNLLQKGLSSHYVKNAFECYNRDIISAGRLAEILLSNESELIQLLGLFNLQLSYDY